MGTSPKKRGSHPSQWKIENLQKLCLAAVLCIVVYFVARPSSNDTSLLKSAGEHTVGGINDRSTNHLGFYIMPKGGEFSPQIAWLMSFPNSGTSFTMTCIERTSNLSTASNYGDEVTANDAFSLSIYPRHPEGPYWEGLSGKLGSIRPLPEQYVLVKTHCGSRCITCPPNEYVETFESYVDACRYSTARTAPNRTFEDFLYPMDRVKKAIHLIRNPFHNFVARFHLDRKNAMAHDKKKWLKMHPSNAVGFQRWCYESDEMYKKEEDELFEHDMIRQLRLSPCHSEVFKYIQWHNLAIQLTTKYKIDTMVIYYEDFAVKFNETVDKILDFLELPLVKYQEGFEAGHEYNKYYTNLDKRRIGLLAKELASEETWSRIEQYFDKSKSTFFDTDLSEDRIPPDVKKLPKQSSP
ncbi:sulfotransferase domain-containing protein [Fragilaria crotonensis]|nr:sulfotransferase domain-containing protein [Fragilaria crotonensis]